MSTSPPTYPVTKYTPRQTTYTPSDFERQDPSDDANFYSVPRFVTHIDDHAIQTLTEYYALHLFPSPSPPPPDDDPVFRILDFCTSHLTHYPRPRLAEAAARGRRVEVIGVGMNAAELDANPALTRRVLADLNAAPDLARALGLDAARGPRVDVATCVVSIDYLVHPVRVLESLRGVTRAGGAVHLVVSNRCFPTKAVRRWLEVDEEERLQMVGDFLWTAGWREVEILVLSDGKTEEPGAGREGWLRAMMGMRGRDPLWVVRGRNVEG